MSRLADFIRRYGSRATTYFVVALFAALALRATPPVWRAAALEPVDADADSLLSLALATPTETRDTLHRGESLRAFLGRQGLSDSSIAAAVRAIPSRDRELYAGTVARVSRIEDDSAPQRIVFQVNDSRDVVLDRSADSWVAREETLEWRTDTVVAEGTIHSSLYRALEESSAPVTRGQRRELAWNLADIFEYRVDMSRDLQPGDGFKVLFERSIAPDGRTRVGQILAAKFALSGAEVAAVRYGGAKARARYFDQAGKSLQAGFLRAPLAFRRISSVFGFRKHPILGIWRAHRGTDYAASAGTPVRAIGDGVIVFAGVKHGFGNVLEVRHGNGYVSRYGHLRGFAKGMHTGSHVSIGTTIGYVGMSGLATAPHLHFEMLLDGVQRDPRVALRSLKSGDPISSDERAAFEQVRTRLLSALDAPVRVPDGD